MSVGKQALKNLSGRFGGNRAHVRYRRSGQLDVSLAEC